jgi:hypothetical protein
LAKGFKDFGLFKHSVLNSIIKFNQNFNSTSTVIACYDKKTDGKYWRNDVLQSYKENRKNTPSPIDKDLIHKQFNILENEIEENLPWVTLREDHTEADDIIGIIAKEQKDCVNVIYSPDKDFMQLQKYDNVYQYDPMKTIFVECNEPSRYLFEHIICGDTSDGVANVFSDEDTIVTPGKKQKPVRKTKVAEMWHLSRERGMKDMGNVYFTPEQKKRFIQNTKLIDLDYVQKDIIEKVKTQYENYKPQGSRKKFWSWCIQNKLSSLSDMAMLA